MSRILIVDDQEANRYYLEVLLQGYRHEVAVASNGEEALAQARRTRPDLVVSDLLMPVMDGYTLLREWKSDPDLRRVPFVVYTATYTQPEDQQLALDLGADAFIIKPAEPDEFMVRLAALLAAVQQHPTVEPRPPLANDGAILTQYNQTLIRKLEQKSARLETANRSLQEDLQAREQGAQEKAELLHALGERVKELRALYEVGRVLRDEQLPLPQALDRVAAQLPIAMQFPEIAAARVRFGDEESVTAGFRRTPWRLGVTFTTREGLSGEIEVVYTAERPAASEGPFLAEERELLNSLGDILKTFLDRRDALHRLVAAQRQQALLLDSVDEGIHGLDTKGRITFGNPAGLRMLGWEAGKFIGRHSHSTLHHHRADGSDYPVEACPIHQTLQDGEVRRVADEVFFRRDGSSFPVEYTCSPMRDEGGAVVGAVVAFRDISERKALEQQMLRIQRMNSIGTLAGGIAHDLNNVLAPIVVAVERLRDSTLDTGQAELVHLVENSARRGAEMVSQVLTFARGVEGRKRAIRLEDVVRDLRLMFGEALPKSIRFVEQLDEPVWPVQADPTQLHQVLLNLCINARDAMPHGGELTVTVANLTISADEATLLFEATAGPYVRVTVEDTGSGIPEDQLEQIFDPFFTTKEVGQGTGLGLATSQAIVRGHGGFIRVYSEVGAGSRFLVYLPATLELQERVEAAEPAGLVRGDGELILVVDDEAAIRQVIRQTLEAFGYHVLVAADGAEAVALYREHRQEVAMVITDMMMPVMDGPATIRVLRRLNPKVRIIAASGLSAGPQGSPDGGNDIEFLAKPYTTSELLHAIRRVLEPSR